MPLTIILFSLLAIGFIQVSQVAVHRFSDWLARRVNP